MRIARINYSDRNRWKPVEIFFVDGHRGVKKNSYFHRQTQTEKKKTKNSSRLRGFEEDIRARVHETARTKGVFVKQEQKASRKILGVVIVFGLY